VKNYVFIIFVFCFYSSFSLRKLTEKDVVSLKASIENDAVKFKDSLLKVSNDFTNEYDIEFEVDIYRVSELSKRKMEIDYSTAGMIKAISEEERDYDMLLNKYYKILRNKLDNKEKNVLTLSQRNWIKFRDSEKELNSMVYLHSYNNCGGSIRAVFSIQKICNITLTRLKELKAYLDRVTCGGW